MSAGYIATEVNLEAASPGIGKLWSANLDGLDASVVDAKLQLGYLHNPAGPGAAILLKLQGQVDPVGVICLQARSAMFGGQRIGIATLSDFAVDKAHRTLGPALMLMRHAVAIARERFEFIVGLPNQKSAAVCRRAGLQCIGTMDRYAKVLASRPYIALHVPNPLVGVLAPLADIALAAADRVRGALIRPALRLSPTTFDDPAIDTIWARVPTDLVLSDRSGAMVRWRYGLAGRGGWQICTARGLDGAPLGFVVWRLQRGTAEVGDFFSLDPARLTKPLMHAFSLHAHRQGATSVGLRFFGSDAAVAGLRGAGYKVRLQDRQVFTNAHDIQGVALKDRWYLTAFDNDAN
jgi:hypothetical protein